MTVPVAAGSARLAPPVTRQRVLLRVVIVGCLAATVWAWRYLELSPSRALDGLGNTADLLSRMLPPDFARTGTAVRLAFETLWMAIMGTTMATVLSIPLGFGAARNTTPHRSVQLICRALIVGSRAIPDLVFAMIFMRVFGIGVLAGVLALGLHSIGMLGKLYADAIEQVDESPREAVSSVGAGKWSTIVTSVVPQVLPSFIGTSLYRLDINLRSGAVLGFVGAGGIGLLLRELTGQLSYDGLLGVIIVLLVFLVGIEFLAAGIRSALFGASGNIGGITSTGRGGQGRAIVRRLARMAGGTGDDTDARSPSFNQERLTPPWTRQRKTNIAYVLVVAGLVIMAFALTRLSPLEIVTAIPDMWDIGTRMIPPDFTTARDGIISGMTETLAIAIVATFVSVFIALPLGLLAARNTTANRIVYVLSRIGMIVARGVPELVLAVIFIVMFKPGAMPGIVALVVGIGAGLMAKLFADAIEEVDPAPREAVTATGASRLQEICTSVLPQAMPALVGNSLYVLDVNLRASTVLGIVGAGGIGTLLQNSLRVGQWQTTAAIIISIFAVVYAIELLAGWIRKQIL